MKRAVCTFLNVSLLAVLVIVFSVPSISSAGSHDAYISSYEGTSTCLQCHMNEALEVHGSVHYQWKGDSSALTNDTGAATGKITGVNDFCIYANINWIGKLTTVTGEQVDGGCAQCHAGLGLKPTADASQQQLENIDCLICHSTTYKRTVVKKADGTFRFEPNVPDILATARDIILSNRDVCLNCHTKAGGGNNFKRGDIEEAHRSPTRDFDVHMGSGMICIDCHVSQAHRIAGRGADLRPIDLPVKMGCEDCHTSAPHALERLNRHTARVNCTVCHIPRYAKVAGTDMFRDWSAPGELNTSKGLYEPAMIKQTNVVPEYKFFNGRSTIVQFGDDATQFSRDGLIQMAAPEGNINDGRIYAFKRHTGKQPIDALGRLLPLKIGIFFMTNNFNSAVSVGTTSVGWTYNGHTFADTERYMGLFHEVAPKEQALSCSDCHISGGGGRLDFNALGYEAKATYNGKPLCESCHSNQYRYRNGNNWDGSSFERVHDTHVDKHRYDCSTCHYFNSAN